MTKIGRPTLYTEKLADEICEAIAISKKGVEHICAAHDHFPHSSNVYKWVFNNELFRAKYLKARESQAHLFANRLATLSEEVPTYIDKDGVERIDAGMLGRAKLEMECLKWSAARLAPRNYGERKEVDILADQNLKMKDELEKIRAELDAKNQKEY